jgi:hypothetical protein
MPDESRSFIRGVDESPACAGTTADRGDYKYLKQNSVRRNKKIRSKKQTKYLKINT